MLKVICRPYAFFGYRIYQVVSKSDQWWLAIFQALSLRTQVIDDLVRPTAARR